MPRGTRRTRRTARPPDWLMMHREKGKADEENNRLPCIDDPSLLAGPGGPPRLHATTYEAAQQHPQASDDAPGTAERPWKTIAKAAEKAGPGDVVVLRGGVYRERVVLRTSGTAQAPIQFEAAPGEEVVVTGADLLSGWQQADETRPIFRVPWPHKFIGWNRSMAHPDDEYHRIIGRCEQVIVDDNRHWPVRGGAAAAGCHRQSRETSPVRTWQRPAQARLRKG